MLALKNIVCMMEFVRREKFESTAYLYLVEYYFFLSLLSQFGGKKEEERENMHPKDALTFVCLYEQVYCPYSYKYLFV